MLMLYYNVIQNHSHYKFRVGLSFFVFSFDAFLTFKILKKHSCIIFSRGKSSVLKLSKKVFSVERGNPPGGVIHSDDSLGGKGPYGQSFRKELS